MKHAQLKAASLVLACVVGACSPSGGAQRIAPASNPALDSLEALYNARADSATMNVHPADARFMTGMIGHHAQALVMSHLAPTNGASEEIRLLASRIINAQSDEIRLMRQWLEARDLPAPHVAESGEVMAHGDQHMHMAGMLTPEQLDELRAARGADFDEAYLRLMIQHHSGAVSMVHELFAEDGAAHDDLTFKLASDIQVDQRSEIGRMSRMLEAMGSGR